MDRVQALQQEACHAAEAGSFKDAISKLREAVAIQPAYAVLHELLAQCLSEDEQDAQAHAAAVAATQLDPQWAEGWLTSARMARNCGLLLEAASAYKACLELDSRQEAALRELPEVEELLIRQLARRVGVPGLRVQQHAGGRYGPGCVVWDSGIVLAKYLIQEWGQDKLQGKQVLELGSGTGVQ
ncbi:hypothetical protein WJX72_010992 [[Myrmecia] bisecta]|uniref:Uncharacterized protein n=1 Tax=[Myrmecia] bisecta TaxID=41462 RepID=A0AAW1QSN3_9CHLO